MGRGRGINMDDDIRDKCIVGGVGCVGIGLLLTLILVPLSFSYIDRNHLGFKKNSMTNSVDRTEAHGNGQYFWGLGKTSVQFPMTWQRVNFCCLKVFTDAGEISLGATFSYRLTKESLPRLYEQFGLSYTERIPQIARAELRNAASNYTTADFTERRKEVAEGLYAGLAARLPATAFVEVSRDRFFLLTITIPPSIADKKSQVFINEQMRITQQFDRTAKQTRLVTQARLARLNSNADLIRSNATLFGGTMRSNAKSEGFGRIEQVTGTLLSSMATTLGISVAAAREGLIKFNMLLDSGVPFTLMSGVSGAVLQSTN